MTPELRGARVPVNGQAAAARDMDRRAVHLFNLCLEAVVLRYDVDPTRVRKRHAHFTRGARPWRWAHMEATPPRRERWARWTCYHVLHAADISMASIGRVMGTDHTTVRYALEHLDQEPQEVRQFAADLVTLFARTGVAA